MTLIIGHRGASKAHRENTLEAFHGAGVLGADWVELDVRRTRDGEFVVHHDEFLGDGRAVAAVNGDELPKHVPSLGAAIEACGSLGVNVEVKNDPAEESFDPEHSMVPGLLETMRGTIAASQLLVTSFDMGVINAVRDTAPHIPTGFLTEDPVGPEVSVGRVAAHGHSTVNPSNEIVTQRWVAVAKEAGLACANDLVGSVSRYA